MCAGPRLNALVATVNHERMPVLLATEAEHEAWLNGSVEEALTLVKPFPPERMRIVQTGYDKRDRLADTDAFGLLQHQAMAVGQRRVELRLKLLRWKHGNA